MKITMKVAARIAGAVIAIAATGCAESAETPTLLASAPIGNAVTTSSTTARAQVASAASVATTEQLSDPEMSGTTSLASPSRNVVQGNHHGGPVPVERDRFQIEHAPRTGGPGPISRIRR
jgi:hypothetical protein